MSVPFVSVVMSVYNGERFLRQAVESILEQSFTDFEFVIINDGSTDGTTALLDHYQRGDSRVRVYHQTNNGLVESLNRGCGIAAGTYIARMDADDVAMPDRLKWQLEFMETHQDVGVVGGAIDVINSSGGSLLIHRYPTNNSEINQALNQGGCPLVHPATLFRKDIFVSAGGYRKVLVDAEDYDLWLRMAERSQLANLEAVVLKYRRHPAQVSIQSFRQQSLSNLAARLSAALRRSGKPDELGTVREVTPAVLGRLGVGEAALQAAVARAHLTAAQSMYEAQAYSLASTLLDQLRRSSEWQRAGNSCAADVRLLAGRLYWRQRRPVKSMICLGHAAMTRPIMLLRPLKPWLTRLRKSHRREVLVPPLPELR